MIPIIILARMTSGRFPGKHLALLGGKPMIVGIIERMSRLSSVWVACAEGPEDAPLRQAAADAGAQITSGPTDDVYGRLTKAVKASGAGKWVLYMGDCPFVDPQAVEILLQEMYWADADHYGLQPTKTGIEGVAVEGFSSDYWRRVGHELASYPQYQECPWQVRPQGVDRVIDPGIWPYLQSPIKLSIDWPLEMVIANKVIDYLGHWPGSYDEILQAYRGAQ